MEVGPFDRPQYIGATGVECIAPKDNFHNPIFDIDKRAVFSILNSTLLISFLFPDEVVDGERPLGIEVAHWLYL